MPRYVNVAARFDGAYAPTKKSLKEALKMRPGEVLFIKTSGLDRDLPNYTGVTVPNGVILSVVGPDPFYKRQWYASVQRNLDGSLRVS